MVSKWMPRLANWYKLNVDAAFWRAKEGYGAGAVVRKDSGEVLMSIGAPLGPCIAPEVAEALAARDCLKLALEAGLNELIVELDPSNIVNPLNGFISHSADSMLVLEDITELVPNFSNVKFVHVKRCGSRVAHELAKWGAKLSEIDVWLEDAPSYILSLLISDISFC
ncbi:hypothetical protein M5689_024853 [Euphorbia peplus]|nr:hypothetical protein M5689_024853 [Euphorbia peplus]